MNTFEKGKSIYPITDKIKMMGNAGILDKLIKYPETIIQPQPIIQPIKTLPYYPKYNIQRK